MVESVAALRQSLQGYGGDLLILKGKPEELLPALVSEYEIAEVYHHREVASEETVVSTHVEDLVETESEPETFHRSYALQ